MTNIKSNYSEEFCNLIKKVNQEGNEFFGQYIGIGNPNAKILIIGKEPAIYQTQNKMQYENEILGNAIFLEDNVKDDFGQSCVENFFDVGKLNPLYPYKGQVFKKDRNVNKGTSPTWYNYQKIINLIKSNKLNSESIDFHEYCFSTDFSTATAKNRHVAKIFFRMHLTIGKSCVYLQPEIGCRDSGRTVLCPNRNETSQAEQNTMCPLYFL